MISGFVPFDLIRDMILLRAAADTVSVIIGADYWLSPTTKQEMVSYENSCGGPRPFSLLTQSLGEIRLKCLKDAVNTLREGVVFK